MIPAGSEAKSASRACACPSRDRCGRREPDSRRGGRRTRFSVIAPARRIVSVPRRRDRLYLSAGDGINGRPGLPGERENAFRPSGDTGTYVGWERPLPRSDGSSPIRDSARRSSAPSLLDPAKLDLPAARDELGPPGENGDGDRLRASGAGRIDRHGVAVEPHRRHPLSVGEKPPAMPEPSRTGGAVHPAEIDHAVPPPLPFRRGDERAVGGEAAGAGPVERGEVRAGASPLPPANSDSR